MVAQILREYAREERLLAWQELPAVRIICTRVKANFGRLYFDAELLLW